MIGVVIVGGGGVWRGEEFVVVVVIVVWVEEAHKHTHTQTSKSPSQTHTNTQTRAKFALPPRPSRDNQAILRSGENKTSPET